MHRSYLSLLIRLSLAALVMGAAVASAWAARPSETLLPDTTKGYVSVADMDKLTTSWDKTQLGQLMQDPVMKPFAEDFKQQLKQRWGRVYDKLGLTIDDLEGVPGGEVSTALIQPAKNQAALALLVDVTGHLDEANALLKKVDQNLGKQKATKVNRQVLGTNVVTYTVPSEEDPRGYTKAVLFLNDNILCATDSEQVADAILGRFSGQPQDNLESLPAYRAVMARAKEGAGQLVPELRWYMNPIEYVETMRTVNTNAGRPRKKGKDMLKVLSSQGFTAIQGIGGFVNFSVDGQYDMIHRTSIFAPPVKGHAEGERYELAARMLRFPNGGPLHPQPWVPRELATYISFNWELAKAFEYADTLVDAVVGEEGVFEDVIRSIKEDPNGPQVDIRSELIAHLGTRCTVISDYALPITPKSERMVMAVEATNEEAVARTVDKTMRTDPDAREREFEGHVIWEIVEQQADLPKLEIEAPIFDPTIGGADAESDEKKRKLPNSAVCVAYGHLFVASHIEFLHRVLVPLEERETLAGSVDYQVVMAELDKISATESSCRVFSRTDEEYRATYELIRTGRMPESETLLGQILNSLLGDGKEGELRPQKIDGHSLPEFEMVRRYFGPAGLNVQSEPTGWFVEGIMLSKESP